MNKKRKQLGRGLSALLGDGAQEYTDLDRTRTDRSVPIGRLKPCPFQPRRQFREAQIAELAQSIKEKGILQPLVVRRNDADPASYEIVCGERRWRAAQIAQLHEVPVIIRELTDRETLEIALIENLHREELSALEEAEAYQRLMADFGHTQDAMAQSIGKSRSHVANMVRLLNLPEKIKRLLAEGRLSAGHGRALLSAKNPEDTAKTVVRKGMTVRETEALVRRETAAPSKLTPTMKKTADTLALERELSDALGLKTLISQRGAGGNISFRFQTLDQLEDFIQRLR